MVSPVFNTHGIRDEITDRRCCNASLFHNRQAAIGIKRDIEMQWPGRRDREVKTIGSFNDLERATRKIGKLALIET